MFEEEDSLPGSQSHTPAGDWDYLTCPSEGHAKVAGGIVRTFKRMSVVTIFGSDFLKVVMEVDSGAGIGVLVDNETGAGMADEYRDGAGSNAALAHDVSHVFGNFVGAFALRANCDGLVLCGHCGLIMTSNQPARNNKPPMGVIAPSQRTFVTARRYSEPEKINTPAAQIQTTVEFRLAAHSAATAWTRW